MGGIIPGAAKAQKAADQARIAALIATEGAEADKERLRARSLDVAQRQRRRGGTILGGEGPTNLLGGTADLDIG